MRVRTLFRPKRLKYMKGLTRTDDCVFCATLKEGIKKKNLLVVESDHAFVVLNKYPYNTAHCLVLPRRHEGDLLELSIEEACDLHELVRETIKVLQEEYEPQGMNIGVNLGKAAGAGIPEHIHYHVIPRWKGDLNFFPLVAESKVVPEELSETAKRLRLRFERVRAERKNRGKRANKNASESAGKSVGKDIGKNPSRRQKRKNKLA